MDEVVDFGDAQVFGAATNYTCILIVERDGATLLSYRRVSAGGRTVGEALAAADVADPEEYDPAAFGSDPWVLAAGEEAEVLRAVKSGAEPLGDVTRQIFQGLITSADPIYILGNRGRRGDRRVVFSRASNRELEIEPDLLKPLASGVDVDPYAFPPLPDVLLFPYRREGDDMRLMTEEELSSSPATWQYLREHEEALRARERGRMDREGWWQFGRNQNLGSHDAAKLGVAATVQHLEIAADPQGGIHFHNVRVNGILTAGQGPSLWTLLVLLNSRLLDYYFRRLSVPHANGYFAANKQFIAPLPIHIPGSSQAGQLDQLGEKLHGWAAALSRERAGFLGWLTSEIGADPRSLPGSTTLLAYDRHTPDELVAVLGRSATRLTIDPSGRRSRELLSGELEASLDRLRPLRRELSASINQADELVYELYEIPAAVRAVVEREYGGA